MKFDKLTTGVMEVKAFANEDKRKKKVESEGVGGRGCNGICNYGKNQFPVARSRVSRVTCPTNEDQSLRGL